MIYGFMGFAAFVLFISSFGLFLLFFLLLLLSYFLNFFLKFVPVISLKILKFPVYVLIAAIICLITSVFTIFKPLKSGLGLSEELQYIVKTDQHDRYAIFPFLFFPNRDEQRVIRVREIVNNSASLTAMEKYNAALVLQHGNESSDYQKAYELALASNNEGYTNKLWQLAYDRWQLSVGGEQKYNSQSKVTIGPGVLKIESGK